MVFAIVIFLTLATTAAQAACPASTGELRADVEAAITAYSEWQWEEFVLREEAARNELSCVQDIVSKVDASRVHLLTAFSAFRAKDTPLMVAAFRAVLEHDPRWDLGADLAAPGSGIRAAFEQARKSGPGLGARIQREGLWYVDGMAAAKMVPTQRTAIVQLEIGDAIRTWYLDGRGIPLDLMTAIEPVADAEPTTPVSRASSDEKGSKGRASWGLIASGAVAGLAAGGAYYYGGLARDGMIESNNRGTAESWETRNHAAFIGSGVLGVAGAGLVVGALVKGRW